MKTKKIVTSVMLSAALFSVCALGTSKVLAVSKISYQYENDTKLQAAVDAVEGLFSDSTHTKLASATTSTTITAARKLVLKSGASATYFKTLSDLCTKASELLDEQTNLF